MEVAVVSSQWSVVPVGGSRRSVHAVSYGSSSHGLT
jgi:hypothetical protein